MSRGETPRTPRCRLGWQAAGKALGQSCKKTGSGKHQNLAAEELISAGPLQLISAEARASNIRRAEQARSAEPSKPVLRRARLQPLVLGAAHRHRNEATAHEGVAAAAGIGYRRAGDRSERESRRCTSSAQRLTDRMPPSQLFIFPPWWSGYIGESYLSG